VRIVNYWMDHFGGWRRIGFSASIGGSSRMRTSIRGPTGIYIPAFPSRTTPFDKKHSPFNPRVMLPGRRRSRINVGARLWTSFKGA